MSSPHTNAAIRDWLQQYGPASSGDYARTHGLTGTEAYRIGQRMAGMHKDGVLTRTGRGGCAHPFVYAVARDVLSKREAMAVALAAKAEKLALAGPKEPKPRLPKVPRIPKPKPVDPARVKVKPSRRVKEDGAFLPAAMNKAQPVKTGLPSSEDFIRAGGVVEVLPSFLDRRAA